MILYKVNKDGDVWSKTTEGNTYEPKSNEFLVDVDFKRPVYNGELVVEGWTLEDTIKVESLRKRNLIITKIKEDEQSGIALSLDIKISVNQKSDDGSISNSEYKKLKKDLKETLGYLKDGDWDSAKTEVDLLSSNNETIQAIYTELENKIGAYLLNTPLV